MLVENRKALFDYEILEKIEAGIELIGAEVKSIRAGKASIAGAYAKIYGGELWLVGCSVSPYQKKNMPENYVEDRPRRLLVKKEEIKRFAGAVKEKGLTLAPLKLYNKNGRIKLELALCKSRKKFDKRGVIKKRESKREIERKLKS